MVIPKVKKALKIAGDVVTVAFVIVVLAVLFFVIKSRIEGGTPNIAGTKIYIVMSGSMAPVFDAGSIVGVGDVKPEQIAPGDIITFKDLRDSSRIITHRVVEIKDADGVENYVTKGDANNATDIDLTPAQNVLGKVSFWVPYAGYLLSFLKSGSGITLLLIIPGAIFIIFQLNSIFKMVRANRKKDEKKDLQVENEHIEAEIKSKETVK